MNEKTKKVIVVGGDYLIEQMFYKAGWAVASQDHEEPHLVCFTGGADVSPFLYGEKKLSVTSNDERRDEREKAVWEKYRKFPKVGICRGGQFLNVMNGGKMWQHVDSHGRDHDLIDLLTHGVYKVTSTHHQMMIPADHGELVGIAMEAKDFASAIERPKPEVDAEVIWYGRTNSLCFQPHPEYVHNGGTRKYFFELLEYFWNYDNPMKEAA